MKFKINKKKRVNKDHDYDEKQFDQDCEGWIERFKREGQYFKDDLHDKIVAGRVAMNMDSMMDWCKVSDPKDIDWEDPVIKVMKLLCDPVYVKLLRRTEEDKRKVYALMDEEMQQAYFMTPVGNNGETLRDTVERSSRWEALKMEGHWAREYIKGRKGKKQDPGDSHE